MSFFPNPTGSVIDTGNSFNSSLGANATWEGEWKDVSLYDVANFSVGGSPSSGAPGVIYFQYSSEPAENDGTVTKGFSLTAPAVVPQQLINIFTYFRLRYVNGGTPLTNLQIVTKLFFRNPGSLTRYLDQTIDQNEPLKFVKAILVGQQPNGLGTNVPLTLLGGDRTTFGEVVTAARISQIQAEFDQPIDTQPVTVAIAGGAPPPSQPGTGLIFLSSGSAAGGTTVMTSRAVIDYIPGREVYVLFTGIFSLTTDAGDEITAGIGDSLNGYFIGRMGLSFGVGKIKNGLVTFVPQSGFNLDPLDGSAMSRFTRQGVPEAVDLGTINVFRIRFGWLSGAPSQFEVLSPDDVWVSFFSFLQPNSLTEPAIATPNLPLQVRVAKAGADASVLTFGIGSWDAGITGSASDQPIGSVSLLNASTSPLAANATYTGVWESVLRATIVLVNTQSDVPSASGGWQVQWSFDGQNLFFTQSLTQTGLARSLVFSIRAPFFRFVYVNGTTAQSTFKLSVMFLSTSDALVTQLVGQLTTEDSVAPPVRSFLAAKDPTGTFRNLSGALSGGVFALDTRTAQLPTTLSGLGNLKVAIEESSTPLGVVDQGAPGAAPWPVDGSNVVQPVSAAALPLPAGAATEATLAAINTDLGPAASYRHIATNVATICKASAGRLRAITVNKLGLGPNTATVTDGASVIAVINTTITQGTLAFNILFSTNLVVTTAGGTAPDLTVIFD